MTSNKYKPGMRVRVLPVNKWKSTRAQDTLYKYGRYYGISRRGYEEMANNVYTVDGKLGADGDVHVKEKGYFLPVCAIELVGNNFNKLLALKER